MEKSSKTRTKWTYLKNMDIHGQNRKNGKIGQNGQN